MSKFIKYCSCILCRTQIATCNIKQHYEICLQRKPCYNCTALIKYNQKFCSRSCAASYNNLLRTEESREQQKKTLKSKRIKKPSKKRIWSKISWCTICTDLIKHKHRKTCSTTCESIAYQNAGLKSAATQVRRSKDEIKLYNLCKEYFNTVSHNDIICNGWDADIIIHDTKTAILWNGPWHYRQMPHKNHSLSQVQNRDKIKINLFKKLNWNVIVFEDRNYTPETAFASLIKLWL